MIKPEIVNAIIDTARIEEVVGDFVTLKKRGANLLGLCPFHSEKTASFTVSPAKGIFKCFGCGKAGNSVHFIMEHEHYTFYDALKYLAKKYNIEIEETQRTAEDIALEGLKERLFDINNIAKQYFSDNLFNTDEGINVGLSYFKERGFYESTIKTFQLGYSLDNYSALTTFANQKGYKDDVLIKSGLAVPNEDGNIYDRFRSRVIFPIHNLSGRVIGFGGRIMSSEKSKAKYINSPETEIYHKSDTLYGIYFSKSEIISKDVCYLVEGYTDVISMYQSGFKNVVASSGTSLTIPQIRLIKRFTENVTIIYDGDYAGIKASLRGIDMILEEGLNVRIIPLPEGEDPDSYVKNNSTSSVMDYFKDKSQDFIRFKINLLLRDAGDDPIKKAEVIKDIVVSISVIPSAINRTIYIQECSSLLNIEEKTLVFEINKLLLKNNNNIVVKESRPKVNNNKLPIPIGGDELEKGIIGKLLLYGTHKDQYYDNSNGELISTAEYIVNEITADKITFSNPAYKGIFDIFVEQLKNGQIPEYNYFLKHKDIDITSTAINIVENPYEISKGWKAFNVAITKEEDKIMDAVFQSLCSFKAAFVKKLYQQYQEELKTLTGEEARSLIKEISSLKEIEKECNKLLNRIIT